MTSSLTWKTFLRKNIKKQRRLVFRLKALFVLKNIFCLYSSPIAKLWSRKKVIFKVFVFWRYPTTLKHHFITDVWRNFKCNYVWEGFHHWLYKRIFNSPCFLILLIRTKYKTIRWNLGQWNLGLTPHFYSLEGELTNWVDKAKYVWLIVGQLPIKPEWWVAPLTLRDFSCGNKQNYFSF